FADLLRRKPTMVIRRGRILLLIEKLLERPLPIRRTSKHKRQVRKRQFVRDFADIVRARCPRGVAWQRTKLRDVYRFGDKIGRAAMQGGRQKQNRGSPVAQGR